jgi:hypothetical protein
MTPGLGGGVPLPPPRATFHLRTQEQSTLDGRYYRLREAVANPKPVQRPHPPMWIGAAGPMMMRVAARHADVWNWAGEGLEDVQAAGDELNTACDQLGRDPRTIRWSAQFGFDGEDPGATIGELRRWHAAGFNELVISCSGPDPVRAAGLAAEKILPTIRQL